MRRDFAWPKRLVLLVAASTLLWAQQGPGPRSGPPSGGHPGPGGKWWDNPEMVRRLAITPDQQKKMDDVLQQSRLKLIDLHATLEKEEVMLEGLMKGPQLDDAKILPSVDRIAQARAELEKANARLMLGIRHVLTPEQWVKLEGDQPHGGPRPQQFGSGGPPPQRGNNGPPPPRPQE